jgi:serine/threonine protein kinase
MAPEVLAGQPHDGVAADIFSCGVILFILLSGVPPFGKAINTDWYWHKLSLGTPKDAKAFWDAHKRAPQSAQAFASVEVMDLINRMLRVRITLTLHFICAPCMPMPNW